MIKNETSAEVSFFFIIGLSKHRSQKKEIIVMEKRKLGVLDVSAVGLGCMGFSHAYGAATLSARLPLSKTVIP